MSNVFLFFCCCISFVKKKKLNIGSKPPKPVKMEPTLEPKWNQNWSRHRFFEKVKNNKNHCNVVQLLKVGLLRNLIFSIPRPSKNMSKKQTPTNARKNIFFMKKSKIGPQDGSKEGGGGVQRTMLFGVMLALGAQGAQDVPKRLPRAPKNPKTPQRPPKGLPNSPERTKKNPSTLRSELRPCPGEGLPSPLTPHPGPPCQPTAKKCLKTQQNCA